MVYIYTIELIKRSDDGYVAEYEHLGIKLWISRHRDRHTCRYQKVTDWRPNLNQGFFPLSLCRLFRDVFSIGQASKNMHTCWSRAYILILIDRPTQEELQNISITYMYIVHYVDIMYMYSFDLDILIFGMKVRKNLRPPGCVRTM